MDEEGAFAAAVVSVLLAAVPGGLCTRLRLRQAQRAGVDVGWARSARLVGDPHEQLALVAAGVQVAERGGCAVEAVADVLTVLQLALLHERRSRRPRAP